MKYSLKNRQFRKRNNIFGERKREDNNADLYEDLKKIEEASEEPDDSIIQLTSPTNKNKDNLFKFINYQSRANDKRNPPLVKQYRAYSNEHRPGKHGLSPINKPLLDNPNIRLTESQIKLRNSKNCDIDSQTVSFNYVPSGVHNESETKEVKAILFKLYAILTNNSKRVDQLQAGIKLILERTQIMMKELTQGIKTSIKMEEQSDLLFNTMRSVYQNLRICKLKQQNLELYFKQNTQKRSEPIDSPIDHTVKYGNSRISKGQNYVEEGMTQQEKESRELACLIDYESEASLNDFNMNQILIKKQITQPVINKYQQSVYDHNRFQKQEKGNSEVCHLSPFQTNKVMSVNQEISQSRTTSPSFLCSPNYSKTYESQFNTFRVPQSQSQYSNQETKLKRWIQSTNQRNIRCWLDEMGCLRRPNNTYMFDDRGEVVTLSSQGFQRLTEQGYLTSVYQ